MENGTLHIYPDVYLRKTNTVANVRRELQSSNVDDDRLTDAEIRTMLKGAKAKRQFQASVADIENGNALRRGKYVAVVQQRVTPAARKPIAKRGSD